MVQTSRVALAQTLRVALAQTPRLTVAQSPRVTILSLFLGSLLGCVDQRVVFFLVCSVRVGGLNLTAACLHLALKLDKLYAALMLCLVLWTVTKQPFFLACKGLFLLAGGSDVTREVSCDPASHWVGSSEIRHKLPALYLHALQLSNNESSYLFVLTPGKSCKDMEN